MDAVEKAIRRHEEKLRTKKTPVRKPGVPWGCGMGWPELKDFDSAAEYEAARRKHDSEYSFNHDGRFWLLPG